MAKQEKETSRKCTNCGDTVSVKDTRGNQFGKWLCVSCWEQQYQRPDPQPTAKSA